MDTSETSDPTFAMEVPASLKRFLIPPWPNMPKALLIGTEKVFMRKQPYKYEWIQLLPSSDEGMYICKRSISKFPDVALIILKANEKYYYACEMSIPTDSTTIVVQRPCFRTAEPFWERGEHHWEYACEDAPSAESGVDAMLACKWYGCLRSRTELVDTDT